MSDLDKLAEQYDWLKVRVAPWVDVATLREKIVAALCIDHGHFSRDRGTSCRTCNRRAERVMAVLAEHGLAEREARDGE